MQLNNKLAIVIPVYNRAAFVARSLEVHVPLAEKYGVALYISDNCSDDGTLEVVREWMSKSPCVFYSCNEKNIGPDRNFEAGLKLPEAEYVWLLGDTYRLPENALEYILNVLESQTHAAIVTNLSRKLNIGPRTYTDGNELLSDLCSIISCLSCLIYHKDLIAAAAFSRYYDSYFIQTGILLEYIADKDASVYWAGDLSVTGLVTRELQKTSWVDTPRVVEVGVEKWVNFIFSLPPRYMLAVKLKAARNFALLSWRGIAVMRANGFLTADLFKRYQVPFWLAVSSKSKFYALFVICRLPVGMVKQGIEAFRKYRSRDNA